MIDPVTKSKNVTESRECGDAVTTSQRPWSVHYGAEIWDANGDMVYNLNGFNHGNKDKKNAALIVDAVNERAKFEEARMEFPDLRPVIIAAGQRDAAIAERDRLRDLVKRMADYAETYHSLGVQGKSLVAEARAAIAEDAP